MFISLNKLRTYVFKQRSSFKALQVSGTLNGERTILRQRNIWYIRVWFRVCSNILCKSTEQEGIPTNPDSPSHM